MLPYRTSGWDGHNPLLQGVGGDQQLHPRLLQLFCQQELVPQSPGKPIGVNHNHRGNRLRLH
jgi:hypothetical protein